MKILLTSFPFKYDGAAICFCSMCNELLYEDRENIAKVLESEGWIICPKCAMELKQLEPSLSTEGQLRKGQVQHPDAQTEFAKWFWSS